MRTLGLFRTALAVSVFALGAGAAAAQEHVFKLHQPLSAQSPSQTQMLEPWARQVEENSGGRVKIEIYPAMTLGGRPPELINQVRDGVVDLIWTVNGYTPGLFPRSEVFELPNVFEGDLAAANLAMRDMLDELREDYRGTEVMFLHVHAGNGIQIAGREIRSPSDMAGLSLRTPSRTGAWVIEALGATPVAMPVPELPQALQRGTVAGALIPWEIIPALQIQEQTDYQIEGANNYRFGTTVFQVTMNQARWDSLPEDIQQAFRDASGPEWWAQVGEIWRGTDDFGIKVATDAGNEHIVLSPEETDAFREALEPVVDRWVTEVSAQGIDAAGLVERAREHIAAHSSGN